MSALLLRDEIDHLPETEHLRLRFIETLDMRKTEVARYALAAWDGETAEDINTSLERARDIFQSVSETAGTFGYMDLGVTAQHCKAQIIAHLEGDYADLAVCPGEIMWFIDTFVEACNAIAEAG